MKSNEWKPIEDLIGLRKPVAFIGLTTNNKWMVINGKPVDSWLIDKYALTHYMIPLNPEK